MAAVVEVKNTAPERSGSGSWWWRVLVAGEVIGASEIGHPSRSVAVSAAWDWLQSPGCPLGWEPAGTVKSNTPVLPAVKVPARGARHVKGRKR